MVVPLVAGQDLSIKGETLSDVGFCCSPVLCFQKSWKGLGWKGHPETMAAMSRDNACWLVWIPARRGIL